METKSASDRPAVEAIGKDIEARVGPLGDEQKKLVGRWVKEVLAPRGWRPDRKGRVAAGNFFSRGTIYRRIVPQAPSEDGAARVAAARALVRELSHSPMRSERTMPSVAAPLTETNEVCPRCVCASGRIECGARRGSRRGGPRSCRSLQRSTLRKSRGGSREAAIARSGCARYLQALAFAPSFPSTRKWRSMLA